MIECVVIEDELVGFYRLVSIVGECDLGICYFNYGVRVFGSLYEIEYF